jgi:pimeloyl-ACP methyl ester carboxylesterase
MVPVLLVALLVGFLPTRLPAQPPASMAGRPVILLLHGRGQENADTTEHEWRRALDAGVGQVASVPYRADDVWFVWYADVLDPLSSEGCQYNETNPRSTTMWFNRDSFQSLWNGARSALVKAVNSVPGADRAVLKATAGDVAVFLTDLRRRCGAGQRLAKFLDSAAVQRRPVILVAHSLGSLVAYNYLLDHRPLGGLPPFEIVRMVTIGSMLGQPEVYQALLGSMVLPPLFPPQEVRSWINLRDGLDPLAVPLSGVMNPTPMTTFKERLLPGTASVRTAHDASAYLRSAPTVTAIVYAWCAAFKPGAVRPNECQSFAVDVP